MDSHLNASSSRRQPGRLACCPAEALGAKQRRDLALQILAGTNSARQLAQQHRVSRQFLARQAAHAEEALHAAFLPKGSAEEQVLFHLPVTKAWLEQLILGLTLICHSSQRGVVELLRDLFDYRLALGTVHNVLQRAVQRSQPYHRQQDLAGIRLGAHDEIFQNGQPVLVGVDVRSTYCYLLRQEEHRDAETWAIRLWELQEQGFHPEATIADAGRGLRAGQALALPDTACRGDVFHVLQELHPLVQYLENRAYEAIAARSKLEAKRAKERRWWFQEDFDQPIQEARQAEAQAVDLAAEVALLVGWLRHDILALAGPDHPTRCALYDFIVAELRAREGQCPHRIRPIVRMLANQRDDVLAFAAQLDRALAALAAESRLPVGALRALFNLQTLPEEHPGRWPEEVALRKQFGRRFFALSAGLAQLARDTVRASSVVENLNSRLRSYFFLRRHLGPDYLTLLQFFLNHRRFLRSEQAERVGKSPAELLTGEAHPHWLEMLGYRRFSRN